MACLLRLRMDLKLLDQSLQRTFHFQLIRVKELVIEKVGEDEAFTNLKVLFILLDIGHCADQVDGQGLHGSLGVPAGPLLLPARPLLHLRAHLQRYNSLCKCILSFDAILSVLVSLSGILVFAELWPYSYKKGWNYLCSVP